MNKKMNRNIMLVLIAAAVVFVVVDFVRDSKKQNTAKELASQQEVFLSEENNTEFDTTEELENEMTSEERVKENKNHSARVSYGANPGDMAYDYELTDIQTGQTVKISDYRGQKVFLNFWASWCPPCRVEAPHLQSFSQNQDEVVVLGVNVNVSESSEENVQAFINEFNLTFQNVYGPEEMFGPFFVESLPTSLFIDSAGVIRERVTGPVTEDVLHAIFEMMD